MAQKLARSATKKARRPRPALGTTFLAAYFVGAKQISIDKLAKQFSMSKQDIADTLGVARDTVYKVERARALKTQSRSIEMLEIIHRISGWAGDGRQAMAWYRAEPIPAFGGRTAESLVKDGHAAAVRDYLDRVATGGFA